MNSARDLHYEVPDGLRLVGTAWGPASGPPVLMLHGGGQTRHSWSGAARRLAASGRRVVALDLRGHGESDWCPRGRYNVADFAGDLHSVLDSFDQPPTVVGASLGGVTALLHGELYGNDRLSGVVLVDIVARIEQEGARRIMDWMLTHPDGFESLEAVADAISAYAPRRKRDRRLEGVERVVRRGDDGRYRWHWDPKFLSEGGPIEVVDRERLLAAARLLRVPTLVVRGRESDVISMEGVYEFIAAVPHAEFTDVLGAGHMVAGDRNDAFAAAVQDFLDRRVSSTSCDPVGS